MAEDGKPAKRRCPVCGQHVPAGVRVLPVGLLVIVGLVVGLAVGLFVSAAWGVCCASGIWSAIAYAVRRRQRKNTRNERG